MVCWLRPFRIANSSSTSDLTASPEQATFLRGLKEHFPFFWRGIALEIALDEKNVLSHARHSIRQNRGREGRESLAPHLHLLKPLPQDSRPRLQKPIPGLF